VWFGATHFNKCYQPSFLMGQATTIIVHCLSRVSETAVVVQSTPNHAKLLIVCKYQLLWQQGFNKQ